MIQDIGMYTAVYTGICTNKNKVTMGILKTWSDQYNWILKVYKAYHIIPAFEAEI
jgi:hypothetical protein